MRLAIAALFAVSLTLAAYQGGAFAAYAGGFWAAVGREEMMLAAFACGLVAGQVGGRGVWLAPLVGLAIAAGAALLAPYGLRIPSAAVAAAIAILIPGLVGASAARPETWMAVAACGVAGLVFGVSVGLAEGGATLERVGGLLGGGAAAIAVGVAVGETAGRRGGGSVRARFAAAVAGVGVYLFVQRLGLL